MKVFFLFVVLLYYHLSGRPLHILMRGKVNKSNERHIVNVTLILRIILLQTPDSEYVAQHWQLIHDDGFRAGRPLPLK